jgi:hypothetical protein
MSTAAYLEYGHYMADIKLEDGDYYGKFTAEEIRSAVYKHFDIDYIDVSLSDKYDNENDVVYVSNMDAGGPYTISLNKHADKWYMKFIASDGTIYYTLCDENEKITAFDTKELYLPQYGYITDEGEYENIYWQYFDETKTLRISGKGEAGTNGGNPGDLYIEFTVKEHEFYERDNDDIYIDLPLTITDATLGCKKEIPTLYDNVKVNISAGTNSGDKQRIKGKGVNNEHRRRKGDMYIVFKVYTPKKLSREQKQLIEKLANTELETDEIKKFNKFTKENI